MLNVANESGKFWYQADALGSVYGLTNQAGALVGMQGYDVFGAPTPAPTGPAGQPFGFTGREHELDSGLVYARARYLNPVVGAWTQPDRLGMIDGPNRYGYVVNAPTLRTDPRGLFVEGIHVYLTAEALRGILTGWDLDYVVGVAGLDADAGMYQLSDYRHGMRAKNMTIEQGALEWANFFGEELAKAAAMIDDPCLETRQWGKRHLGYGIHALEDYYSPPHRMTAMNWFSWDAIMAHRAAEAGLRPESAPVREALTYAKEYALLFSWMRRMPTKDVNTLTGIAWGYFGKMLVVDVTTAP